ncbi:SatD family protein [Mycoplasmatota bacterium WC44]
MEYIVITADVVNSKLEMFGSSDIELRLKELNLMFKDDLAAPFSIMKGDEIQSMVNIASFSKIFKIIRSLKYIFGPYKLRIGVGVGDVYEKFQNISKFNNSWEIDGQAFHLARAAMDSTRINKRESIKMSVCFNFENKYLSDKFNIIYSFVTDIIDRWKEDTWNIINELEKGIIHEEIARILDYDRSNVTKKIGRSNWYKIITTEKLLISMFERGE